MAATVYIPTSFRWATGNRDRVEATAASVGDLLDRLERTHSDLKGLMWDGAGHLRRHINVHVNNEAIDALQGLDTRRQDGDEVATILALAGGAGRLGHLR